MRKKVLLTLLGLFFMFPILSSQTRAVVGLHDNTPDVFALTNARIFINSDQATENSTLVIRDGIIEAVGPRVSIPADAWVIDMSGKTIYPGFIDLWVESGFSSMVPDAPGNHQATGNAQEHSDMMRQMMLRQQQQADTAGASHWNPQVRSWFDASRHISPDDKAYSKLRSQGFTIANKVSPLGIFRGQSSLVALGERPVSNMIVKREVGQALSFSRSREVGGIYPNSRMGVIALMRQTWYDAQWYDQIHQDYLNDPSGKPRPEVNLALEALLNASKGNQPVIFEAADELTLLRAAAIAGEFGLNAWVKGSGYEYRRLNEIKALNIPLIIPLNFPSLPEVERPEQAMGISLAELRHWDYAPENPGMLHQAGVSFALTSFGMDDQGEFLKNLRLAVNRGLPPAEAIRALTSTPASMLGMQQQIGSLEKGKMAHLIVADGDIFEHSTKIEEVWVDGVQFYVNKGQEIKPEGTWIVQGENLPEFEMKIQRNNNRLSGNVCIDETEIPLSSVAFDGHRLAFAFRGDTVGIDGFARFSATIGKYELFGIAELPQGQIAGIQGRRLAHEAAPVASVERVVRMSEGPARFPSMEFGYTQIPEQPAHLLIRNATIWTQGPQGRLDGADMLVSGGKIVSVGKNITPPRGAQVIDAEGRHITPGLVDPHSHASTPGGVNESGNAIVSETRIEDVISGDNIWTYRMLAGGLTTASLLHGSANPIGGQNGVIKLRWGALPSEMLLQQAKPGLKLALGENVKGNTSRYPNTRMGTEQIIRDAFTAARHYKQQMQEWEKDKSGIPPRRNLRLDALVEVLNGERIVHAHAYRQDEMHMLIRLAEELDFRIASFEHAVEGYKIAEVLADHGAAAVVWTDWSSFKMEAYDAIIYNARLLLEQGVLTTLHSDNTQLSTRMNWEAGKMVATGIDEIAAMDLITINPARVLGAQDAIGSLEPGKDADFVIWSHHPLSGFSHAEQTWIDGRKYFDRQVDLELRQEVINERAVLIQKVLEQKNSSSEGRSITRRDNAR